MKKRTNCKKLKIKLNVLSIIIIILVINISSLQGTLIEEKHQSTIILGNILFVGGGGSGNYSSIQNAIDASVGGDTIFVYDDSSPYYENVIVDKSIQLVGENRNSTVIDGGGTIDVIFIFADSINVSGFTIQNSGSSFWDAGIELRSNHSNIFNNIIYSNLNNGINLISSKNNKISNNIIELNNHYGIFIQSSQENKVIDNIINSNDDSGIRLDFSTKNNVSICNFSKNGIAINLSSSSNNTMLYNDIISNNNAIYLDNSINNLIFYNNIKFNKNDGVHLYRSSDNIIYDNNIINNIGDGIFLHKFSCNNTLSNNIITNNGLNSIGLESNSNFNIIQNNNLSINLNGIHFLNSKKNVILDNIISDNQHGLLMTLVERNNEIIDNIIYRNDYGALLYSNCSNNSFYHNVFYKNTFNSHDEGSNIWDNGYPSGGNYWDDYDGIDRDGDGVGDTPHNISGGDNKDIYPLGFYNTPHEPTITGTTSGKPGIVYEFTFDATDPNNDDVFYHIEWGDGFVENWIGPYSSGEEITLNHSWSDRGKYVIKAKSKDINGLVSGWGTLEVSMPKITNFYLFIEVIRKIIERFPLIENILSLIASCYKQ